MESSDPSSADAQTESDIFQSDVQTDSANELEIGESVAPLAKRNEKFSVLTCYIFLDYLAPLFMLLCAIVTTGVLGMLLQVMLIVHFTALNKAPKRVMLIFSLGITFIIAIVIFISGIVSTADPDDSFLSTVLGLTFHNVMCDAPLFGIVVSLLTMIQMILTLMMIKSVPLRQIQKLRVRVFRKGFTQYLISLAFMVCLAVLGSTNMSYFYIPLLIYYLYTNISLAFCGRVVLRKSVHFLMAGYALVFSIFEFYMFSFLGLWIAPVKALNFTAVESKDTQRLALIFSVLLTIISIELLTANEPGKWLTKRVPHMFKYFADASVILLVFCVFLFAAFYPSLLALYWMAITFWASFCSLQVVKRLFFPFLALTFCICFVVLGMYQYTDSPEDDGTDRQVMFSKVFGLYNFVGNSVFTFEILGFLIMGWMGQIGRYRYRQKRPIARKRKQYIIPDIENINVDKLKKEIHLTKISLRLREREKRLRNVIKRIGMNFLTMLYYIAQATSFMLTIYGSFQGTRYAFQVFGMISLIFVVSMSYHAYFFRCIAFLSGLIIMTCAYYKSFDIDECYSTNSCLTYGVFDEMWRSGLVPPIDMSLVEYTWPILIVFIINVVFMRMKHSVDRGLPPYVIYLARITVIVCQLTYVFYWKFNAFSMIYFVLSVFSFSSLIFGLPVLFGIFHFLTSLSVSIELILYYMTHQKDARDWLCSFVSPSVIDLTSVVGLNGKVMVLAFMEFTNSVSFRWWFKNNDPQLKRSEVVREILTEGARLIKSFHFYACWILVFAWSISRKSPTLIKFLFMAIFHFGPASARLIHKGRVVIIVVLVLYILVQFSFDVFYRDVSPYKLRLFKYIGCYFSHEDNIGDQRVALGYQVGLILLLLVTCHPECHAGHSEHFESLALTRVYNGICALLHYWLPVICQTLLFVSTFCNLTVFAWISFIILAIFVAKRSSMRRTAGVVTFCLNVCFLVQYILYLGWPKNIFSQQPWWSLLDGVDEATQDNLVPWLRYLGVYSVQTDSLFSSCLAAMASTFFLQFYQVEVDYDARYRDLPIWAKGVVNIFVENAYQILMSLAIICTSLVTSMDGVLFYLVMALLFIGSILFGYNRKSTMTVVNGYMLAVFSMKVLSRIPIFVENESVKKTFDLPFRGQCENVALWIIIFLILKLCDNVTRSPLFREREEYAIKHLAYRFVRERQLRIIEKLDQDILIAKRNAEVSAIFRDNHNFDLFEDGDPVKVEESRNLGDEVSSTCEKQASRTWSEWLYQVLVVNISRKILKLLCSSLPVNLEPGMNVLTLESVTVLMKRCLNAFINGRVIELEPREQEFLRSLPPSFTHQYTSLACLIHYKYIQRDDIWFLLLKYVFLFLRKCSLPVLVVVSIAYALVNPFVFAIVVLSVVLCVFCSMDIRSNPYVYRFFAMFVFAILGLRSCARASVIRDRLLLAAGTVEYLGNTYSLFGLIGIHPDNRITAEIFLFLATIWFIQDRLRSGRLFSPNHYFNMFKASLEGFPEEYCYGIINDPVEQLGMKAKKPASTVSYLREQFQRKSLRSTAHKTIALSFDLVSLVLLIILWNYWETGQTNVLVRSNDYTFRISVSFVFILLVHVVFTLVVYFLQVAQNYFWLLIVNGLWMVYSLGLNFFYLGARSPGLPGSLYLFLFIRLIAHIVVAHKCYTGRIFVTFRCPRFVKNHRPIIFANRFVRAVPFVFELQNLLTWMIEPTKVSLHDFFLVRDIAMRLEILISRQIETSHKQDKNQQRFCHGMTWLFIFIALVFIPLFILVDKGDELQANPIQFMTVSIGFAEYPALYTATARIRPISAEEKQILVSTDDENLRDIASTPGETSYIASLASESNQYPQWTNMTKEKLIQDLRTPEQSLTMSLVIEMAFRRPATKISSRSVRYQQQIGATAEIRQNFLNVMDGNTTALDTELAFPLIIFVVSDLLDPVSYTALDIPCILNYSPNDGSWRLTVGDWQETGEVTILVYSEPVTTSLRRTEETRGQDELMVIYILLLVIVGVIVRSRTLGHLDHLWIHRLDAPQKLYNMIMAIQLVRNAGDVDKEAELVSKFLDIVRSHEQVLTLTSRT